MIPFLDKILATVAAAGIISAVVAGILYFVELPIFTGYGLAWLLTFALISAGVAVFALIAKSLWSN